MNPLSDVLSGTRRWCVVHGEASDVLWVLPDESIDSMVTDPPSGIGFMGRDWDSDFGGRDIWVERLTGVMAEAWRVLKPGAHGLVWALPRTSHWTATALEDAGFEVRDRITHLFGTGFPKSHDVSKAIDAEARQWDGWGTALKPAAEDWWLVRKPFRGTVADNVLKHGCGGLNIDACRIATDWSERPESWKRSGHLRQGYDRAQNATGVAAGLKSDGITCHPDGRWPAHVVLSHSPECGERCGEVCPVLQIGAQSGTSRTPQSLPQPEFNSPTGLVYGMRCGVGRNGERIVLPGDSGTATRFFYCAKPGRAERELGLDGFRVRSAGEATGRRDGSAGITARAGAGTGGARNAHPTVKSLELMRYLARLVTPPGGVVLDQYCGSGSTGMAAILEGMRFIGIELNDTEKEPFVSIARARIAHCADWKPPPPRDAEPPRQRSLFEEDPCQE